MEMDGRVEGGIRGGGSERRKSKAESKGWREVRGEGDGRGEGGIREGGRAKKEEKEIE